MVRHRLFLLLIALLFLTGPRLRAADACSARPSAASLQTLIDNDVVFIPIRINNSGERLNFLIDTGTGQTIISKQSVEKLHLPEERRITLQRPEGEVSGSLVRISTLGLGTLKFSELEVMSFDLTVLAQSVRVPLDGILGLDIIDQVRFTIDYSNKLLTICPPVPSQADSGAFELKLRSDGRSWMLPVFLNGSIKSELVLDTGNNFTTLSWSSWQRLTERWQPGKMVGGLRAPGEQEGRSYLTRLDSLQIGNFNLSRPPILVHKPVIRGALAEVPGLLGGDVLMQFVTTFDLPQGRLLLKLDPKYRRDPLRFTGLGLQVQNVGDFVFVAAVWEDSPASHGGIIAGDQILRIDGRPVNRKMFSELRHWLHGPEGDHVKLRLRRENRVFEQELDFRNLLP